MIRRLQSRDERGSALVVALAFLSLFGVFIAAVLSQVSTNLRLTSVTRAGADRLLAADGGLEWGVQNVRTQDGACATVSEGIEPLISGLNVNGRSVSVECKALAGAVGSSAGEQWSVIATNGINTAAGSSSPEVTGGDIWAGGALNLNTSIKTSGADVIRGTASCAGFIPTGFDIGVPDTASCSTASTPDVPHALPAVPPVREPSTSYMCNGNQWRIWHPGTYSPAALPDGGTFNYLESGVYYFEDLSPDWSGKTVVGGTPPAGESSKLNGLCPGLNDTSAGAASRASGSGVTIVLGGSASLLIHGSATSVELYSRVPATPDGTPGISIMTVPTTGSGYKRWAGSGNALTVSAVLGRTAIHGLVYARNAPVAVTTNTTAPLLGGVVASTLTITPNSGAGKTKAVAALGRRTLLLTSTAAPAAPGEIAAVQSAVVKIANDLTRTASVRSWRAQ